MTKLAFIVCAALCAPAFAVAADTDDDEAMGRRVQALLHAHQADVFACVQKEPSPVEGELLVRVFVGENGASVARAEVLKNGTHSSTVGKCIDDRIRGWDVTSLKAGEGDQLVFPLAFRPGDPRDDELALATFSPPPGKAPPHARDAALFVVRGHVRIGKELLGPDDLALAHAPFTVERGPQKEPEDPLVVEITGAELSPLIVRATAPRPLPIAGGRGAASLYLDGTRAPIAIEKLTAQKGVKIPPHTHPQSAELLYIVDGRGTTLIGGKPVATTPGAILRIPAGVEHSLSVDEPLVAVQVYAPAGPEQRFKNSNGGSK